MDFVVSRFYNGTRRKAPYFHLISSTSLERWSIKDLEAPCIEENGAVADVLGLNERCDGLEENPRVAASCKGLVCLHYRSGEHLLWNPFTKGWKLLSSSALEFPPCNSSDHASTATRCTAFPMSCVCGLGGGELGDDYKFVRFVSFYFDDEDGRSHGWLRRVELYSLKNDSWKVIPHPGPSYSMSEHATYVRGFCYWDNHNAIVSFDVVNEYFSILPYPDSDIVKEDLLDDFKLVLIDFGGFLGAVIYPKLGVTKLFMFWIMKEHGKWTRNIMYDVRLDGAQNALGIGFCSNGPSLFLEGKDGKLLEYNYTARELNKIDGICAYPLTMTLFPYVESTVQLK